MTDQRSTSQLLPNALPGHLKAKIKKSSKFIDEENWNQKAIEV